MLLLVIDNSCLAVTVGKRGNTNTIVEKFMKRAASTFLSRLIKQRIESQNVITNRVPNILNQIITSVPNHSFIRVHCIRI